MRAAAAVAAIGLVLAVGAPTAEAVPSVTPSCSPAPQDCSAWYRSDVSIHWTVLPSSASLDGCEDKTFITDTKGTHEFCRATDGSISVTVEVTIRVDKTAPVVTGASPSRGADVNGWYRAPVAIAFAGTDQTSDIASCTNTTYGGPDSGSASVAGTCTDNAGNESLPLGYGLNYDASAPIVTGATAERQPNAAGWFNRPISYSIQATDGTSGVADCPPVTYAGPDSPTASFGATCSDFAGNAGSRAFALKYDSTPPVVADLGATAGDGSVALSWRASADAESVEVTRTPGVGADQSTIVFRGPGTRFVDSRVDNGVRYAYVVRVQDPAGNAGSDTATAVPRASAGGGGGPGTTNPTGGRGGRRLLAPARGAVVRFGHPPLLQWTLVQGARYYNVQLFRGGRKILSAWPRLTRYKLRQRWTYRGRPRRLRPGKYRWVVWPGFGRRSKADYGRRIGPSTFLVRRDRAASR